MKALITGGAGYVGNLLAGELLNDGAHVTILDNFTFGYQSILHLASDPNLTLTCVDIRDADAMRRSVKGFDTVFHLAALSGYSQCEADPGTAWAVNVEGTRNVIAALEPEQLLVFASSTSIYGPPTLYARTKAQAEEDVMQREMSIAIRWATLFGVSPRMRHELLPNAFTRQAVTRGHLQLFSPDQRRTFMHVSHAASDYAYIPDIADALVGKVWNVGDVGLTCTKRELVEHIVEQVPGATYEVMDAPDADGRDIDVDFSATHELGLSTRTHWGFHLPELVRLYSACEVAE